MYRYTRALITGGVVVLLVLLGGIFTGQGKAIAEPLDFDFTYTCDETVKVATVWDTVQFKSFIANIGTEADAYDIYLTENPPTPQEWWVRVCVGIVGSGGFCWDTLDTQGEMDLEPADTGFIDLDIIPRTEGQSNITITVESRGNPGVKLTKSITFILSAHEQAPVTNRWGLIILILLLLTSGLYLGYRRYRLVRQT